MSDEKLCFVISPVGEDRSEIRKRADQILKFIIKPACEKCGFRAIRADQISEPGNITSQVIQHVLEAPMVVADLTGSNGNVFYELALRHAVKKPFVQLIEAGESIPFDVATMRTVFVNHQDMDSVYDATQELERQIRACEGRTPEQVETPISKAIDFQAMGQSGDPMERSIAELGNAIGEIRADVERLVQRLNPKVDWVISKEDSFDHLIQSKVRKFVPPTAFNLIYAASSEAVERTSNEPDNVKGPEAPKQ